MANVELGIDVDVDGAWKLKKLLHDLKKAARQAKQIKLADVGKAMQARTKALGRELTDQTRIHKRHFDSVDKMVKAAGGMIHKGIAMAAKFAAIQVAVLGAGLLAVHAAFVIGQTAMKAYNWLLKAGAGAIGALATAASIAAAAMREHQAAMYAYKGTNMSEFGSGLNQVRVQMRMMQTDSQLATIGAEGLNAALAEIYKTGNYDGGSQKLLKSLMDFGSAGQDVAKGAAAAGKLIATIQDPKANFSKMKEAAKELGPEMENAIKKLKITTKEGLVSAIGDGTLAAAGGVAGQFDTVSGTLISKFKAFKTQVVAMFGDYGQPLLGPAKEAMDQILFSVKRTFIRISGSLNMFSQGSFFDGLLSAIEKMEDFFVKFVNNHLPKAQGLMGNMGNWMNDFKNGWDMVLNKLRPFIEGARVLETMFGNIFRIVGSQLADGFGHVNDLLKENRKDVEEFGSKIGNLITTLFKYGKVLRDVFFEALPFINKIIDGVTRLLDTVFSLMGGMRSLFGGGEFSSFLMLAGAIAGGRSMKKTIGGTISKAIPVQDIKANIVNISGGVVNGTPMHGTTAGGQTTGAAVRNANALGQTGRTGAGAAGAAGDTATAAESIASRSQRLMGESRKAVNESNRMKADALAAKAGASGSRSQQGGGTVAGTGTGTGPSGTAGSLAKRQITYTERKERKAKIEAAKVKAASRREILGLQNGTIKPTTHAQWAMQDKQFMYGPDGAMLFDDKGQAKTEWKPGGRKANLRRTGYTEAKLTDAPGDTYSKDSRMGRIGTGYRNARSKMFREPRTTAGYAKLFGDGKGMKGKLNGVGASMGASMGLGLAASIAPKEMQGALALGSSLSAINPMLGMGVGLIGAGMQANNPLGGALMGAAGGAAMGAKFGPWGAAIGGLGGALVGGIGSWWNKNKRKKQEAAKVGKDIVKQARDSMMEGLSKKIQNIGISGLTSVNIRKTMDSVSKPIIELQNETRKAQEYILKNGKDSMKAELQRQFETGKGAFAKYLPDQDAVDKATGDIDAFFATIATQGENEGKVLEYVQDKYTQKLDALSKALGKSGEDIIKLAQITETNLADVEMSFSDTYKKIVGGLVHTQQGINNVFSDQAGNFATRLTKFQEQQKAPAIVDEIGLSVFEANKAGTLDATMLSEKMMEMQLGLTQLYGGNAQQAATEMARLFGPNGAAFDQVNGFFNNPAIEALLTTGDLGKFMAQESALTDKTNATFVQDQITTALGVLGQQKGTVGFGPDLDAKIATLAKTDFAAYNQLTEFLDPTKDSSLRQGKSLDTLTPEQLLTTIGAFFPDITDFSFVELDKETTNVETELGNMGIKLADVSTALQGFIDGLGAILGSAVDKDGNPIISDTTTPRGDTASSRFNATMMKHQALSSMVTGKRQITSGMRNFNLGSINSDHVTGGALDLVGQNLGQYKSTVEANGGFAEFHGVNASRHLHVVPSAAASGDTSTAVSVGSSPRSESGGAGGSTNNYSININGYNKNPQQLAAEVLALIKSNDRSITERR